MILIGKTIQLRNILIKDSKFIATIIKKKSVSKYLNNPPTDINHQIKWTRENIKNKGTRDFIILNKKRKKIGTIALNDIDFKKRSAEWGRWICLGNSFQSIESFLLLLKYSFYNLKLKNIYSLTNIKNNKVLNFQIRSGGKYCGTIKNKYLMRGKKIHAVKYTFNKKSYLKLKKKIVKAFNFNFQ
jgi:RimJ/RimL family protein N-acetyltransferase